MIHKGAVKTCLFNLLYKLFCTPTIRYNFVYILVSKVMSLLVRSSHAIFKQNSLFSPSLMYIKRSLASIPSLLPDITFEELSKELEAKVVILIDVRVPKELHENGWIPNSYNISVQTLGSAILLNPEDFSVQLGFKKPALNDAIVVSCLAGIRSRTAQLALIGAGYTNVRSYGGSFNDWVEKGGNVDTSVN